MGLVSDIVQAIPKPIMAILAIAIFVNVGATIINVVIFLWNFFVVNGANAINGCALDPSVCMPAATGFYIFGINFGDYWVMNALIFFPALAYFAIKYYAMVKT